MNDNSGSGPFFGGLEIGAVSVKWVRRLRNGPTIAEIIQHDGNPRKEVQEIFDRHECKDGSRIVVTGQAARILFDLPYRSETECLEKALSFLGLKPDILISLGGETFSVYPVKNGMIKNIISTSKCAAGSGEFIVQQFQRMGLTMEEGIDAANKGKIIPLATRCSVHCKSDATHKLNKGECTPGDIAKSLIHDLAKKIGEMVEVAQWPARSIVVAGGVALNELFVDYFRSFFNDTDVIVLTESPYLEAFGASLYALELSESLIFPGRITSSASKIEFENLKPLKEAESFLDYRVDCGTQKKIIEGAAYILGVDAGSTTTKAVLLNHLDGSVGAACYLRTLGNPVMATQKCLADLIKQVGGKSITIIQAGATGSAREMVSVYLDNCLSFNEILAHARAAAREMPDVDTVFEIGGQDSKFISFLNGVPVDYAMNEGCSAGTGSFLEESASVDMGVAVNDISGIAEGSHDPIAFGERCAAFINTDLRNALQQGASQDDVTAGLVYSIADNYISRIVGPRHVGENILFLGGVALNRSVALAMAARTKQKIVVPAYPELMGSVGTALMARDLLQDGGITDHIRKLDDLVSGEMEVKGTFRCKACENRCEIERIGVAGRVYPFGGVCSKYERQRQGETRAEGLD
nr:activase [Deltaproteobacteria bacterium]